MLPYLELAEMEAFAKCSPRFRQVVNSYLERGGKLVIKAGSFNRYKDNPVIYAEYERQTTALELIEIDAYKIFPHFANVTDLTLREVKFDEDMVHVLPRSLKNLRLICNADTSPEDVLELLERSIHSLEHLAISFCDFEGSTEVPFTFTKLKSLTLVNYILIASIQEQPLSPVLEKFHVKISEYCGPNEIRWASIDGVPIKSLTLDDWDRGQEMQQIEMIKSLGSLKHLKIIKGLSLDYKDQLDALHLESMDV